MQVQQPSDATNYSQSKITWVNLRAAAAAAAGAGRVDTRPARMLIDGRGSITSTLFRCSWKAGVTQAPAVFCIPDQLKAPSRAEHWGQLSLPWVCPPVMVPSIQASGSTKRLE